MTDLEFLMTEGVPFTNLNDMWMIYWDSIPVEGNNFNDRMYRWLGSLGFAGSLPDRYSQWKRGGSDFDGGLFANGGFEDGFAGWANFGSGDNWVASSGASTVENPSAVAGKFLYQNKTLISGATYEISALKISGDAVVTFCIDDADSHISIEDGVHQFIGAGVQMSYGLTLSEVGTVVTVCDYVRLIEIIPANAVTDKGDYVRHNGAIVTYTP